MSETVFELSVEVKELPIELLVENRDREREQFELLQRKWGSKIVKEDSSNKGRTDKQKMFDYNPIIVAPIKGI